MKQVTHIETFEDLLKVTKNVVAEGDTTPSIKGVVTVRIEEHELIIRIPDKNFLMPNYKLNLDEVLDRLLQGYGIRVNRDGY